MRGDFIMLRQLEQMESALIISNFPKLIHIDVRTPQLAINKFKIHEKTY